MKVFICNSCNYETDKKYRWTRHVKSDKHKKTIRKYKCICGNEYIHRQSLHRHRTICNFINNIN